MANKTHYDPDTEAAVEVVEMEQMEEKLAETEQEKKEKLIAKTYRMMGRIETADIFGKLATVSSLVWLKQVKDSKIYKDIPGVETWETFCNRLGKSRRLIDENIQNLSLLGEEFLATCRQFSLGYKDLRKLRKSVSDGTMIIDGDFVVIGEERIPISPDHKDDLEAAFESILDDKDRQLEEANVTLKAKDRVLGEKERVINKQEEVITKYEREIKARGFEPGEENFIQEMENMKTILVGMELKMDPRNMPEEMTPLMRAAYIGNLDHFKRTMTAYFDDATNLYGDAGDDDWVPPHEREAESSKLEAESIEKPGTVDCGACQFHKGMSNKTKGVKIPGNFGKCTRLEGLCFSEAAVDALKIQGGVAGDAE